MPSAILAYVPVLHNGYLKLFAKYPEAKELYLLDESLTHQWRSLEKDLRALPAEQMKTLIESLSLFDKVILVTKDSVHTLADHDVEFIMPDEELNHELAAKFFLDHKITFDAIFLRWDKKRSLSRANVEPNVEITQTEFDQQVMGELGELITHSSDWWRQTGSALVKDGKIILTAKNSHMPFDQQHYVDGDPRASFSSGEHMDKATSLHAEGAVIAEAAKQGISTEGAWLYATTFPCPYCAPIIASAGIKKLFYQDGYSLIDGANMLRAKGVEIIKVIGNR